MSKNEMTPMNHDFLEGVSEEAGGEADETTV